MYLILKKKNTYTQICVSENGGSKRFWCSLWFSFQTKAGMGSPEPGKKSFGAPFDKSFHPPKKSKNTHTHTHSGYPQQVLLVVLSTPHKNVQQLGTPPKRRLFVRPSPGGGCGATAAAAMGWGTGWRPPSSSWGLGGRSSSAPKLKEHNVGRGGWSSGLSSWVGLLDFARQAANHGSGGSRFHLLKCILYVLFSPDWFQKGICLLELYPLERA